MQYRNLKMLAIDLDGTLVDSVPDLHAAIVQMQQALFADDKLKIPSVSSTEDVLGWVGNGIERLVHRAITNTLHEDAPTDVFESGLAAFRTAYQTSNGRYSSVYPNVVASLEWILEQQIPVCCITNKSREFSLSLLQTHNLSGYFSQIIAGDDVINKKPHPESLMKAAMHYGVEPADCLMIGDSVSDVNAARAAGFHFVGVSYGYNHGASLHDEQDEKYPFTIVDDFSELTNIINH